MNRCIMLIFAYLWSSFLFAAEVEWGLVKARIEKNKYLMNGALFSLGSEREFVFSIMERFFEEKSLLKRKKRARYYNALKKYDEAHILVSEPGNVRVLFENELYFNCIIKEKKSASLLSFPNKKCSLSKYGSDFIITFPFSVKEKITEIGPPLKFKEFDFSQNFGPTITNVVNSMPEENLAEVGIGSFELPKIFFNNVNKNNYKDPNIVTEQESNEYGINNNQREMSIVNNFQEYNQNNYILSEDMKNCQLLTLKRPPDENVFMPNKSQKIAKDRLTELTLSDLEQLEKFHRIVSHWMKISGVEELKSVMFPFIYPIYHEDDYVILDQEKIERLENFRNLVISWMKQQGTNENLRRHGFPGLFQD